MSIPDAGGWIDEAKIVNESLIGTRGAGVDVVLTYFVKQWAKACHIMV